jgi:hypothetical protein
VKSLLIIVNHKITNCFSSLGSDILSPIFLFDWCKVVSASSGIGNRVRLHCVYLSIVCVRRSVECITVLFLKLDACVIELYVSCFLYLDIYVTLC